MAIRNRCSRIVVAFFLVAGLAVVVGCGRTPRGANATPPQPVAAPPRPAPVQVAQPSPVEPAPAVEPAPVEVVEPEPAAVEAVEPEPIDPNNVSPEEYLTAADVAADRGDCATAIELVRRYRTEQSDNVMLRLREAGLANDCGRPEYAISLLEDFDARTRAMEPVTAVLADAYLLMNRPGKAAMTWELRYIVDHTAWDAAVHASTMWLEADVYSSAQWWYERAVELAPDSPEVQMLAMVFEPESEE